jgi:2',3'-cyclic-nucleotide 2'-phosphodiesterase (5'-nucleotidase family)
MGSLEDHRNPTSKPIARFLASIGQFLSPIIQLPNYSSTRWTLALSAALLTVSCSSRPSATLPSFTLSVIGTNDLHGGVLESNGRGGLALLDGYVHNVRAARARDGGAVLLLDGGDLFQGTLESNLNEGEVVIAAYNAIGYDAAAVGNHEFDFGPSGPSVFPQSSEDDPRGALKARASQARFPFLAANIIDKNTGRPVSWDHVKPSTMRTVNGVKIGIVGLATTETLGSTLSANTSDLDIAPLAPALEAEAKRLRAEGATMVIATAHAGGRCTKFDNPADLSSCEPDAEIFKVARALPSGLVDAIVAGHRHEGIAHEVAGIPIISAFSSGRAFGRVDLTVDRASGRVTAHRLFPPQDICERHEAAAHDGCAQAGSGVQAQYEGAAVAPSLQIEAILAPAVAAATDVKNQPLNASVDETLADKDGETALGNLLADWMRLSAGSVDVAIANTGGVRAALPAGLITYGRLFEVTPFDNREARLTLTGAELATVVSENLKHRGDLIVLSGVRAAAACEARGLRVSLRRDSGRPVGERELLNIVTSDFLATGGSDFFKPVMPFRRAVRLGGPIVRDEIAQWLTRSATTWHASDLFDPNNHRVAYAGRRPVECGGGQ